MADGEFIGSFESLDYAFGSQLAACFSGLASDGSKEFKRFVQRDAKDKIFLLKNEDVQTVLRRIAGLAGNGAKPPRLPLVVYWRQPGIVGDDSQYAQVVEAVRYVGETGTKCMRLTALPFVFTFSVLFLSWERDALERMQMAYFARFAPLGRKHSRFTVPCKLDGETFDVGASMSTPRSFATSTEHLEEGRLFASRIDVEVRFQGVYGKTVDVPETVTVVGKWGLME